MAKGTDSCVLWFVYEIILDSTPGGGGKHLHFMDFSSQKINLILYIPFG